MADALDPVLEQLAVTTQHAWDARAAAREARLTAAVTRALSLRLRLQAQRERERAEALLQAVRGRPNWGQALSHPVTSHHRHARQLTRAAC